MEYNRNAFIALFLFISGSPVQAQGPTLTVDETMSAVFTTNAINSPNPESDFQFSNTVRAILKDNTPIVEYVLIGQVRNTRYDDFSSLDTDSLGVGLTLSKTLSDYKVSFVSSISSDYETIFSDHKITLYQFGPRIERAFKFSDTQTLTPSFQVNRRLSDIPTAERVEIIPSIKYEAKDFIWNSTLSITGTYAHREFDSGGREDDNFSITAGLAKVISDNLKLSLGAKYEKNDSSNPGSSYDSLTVGPSVQISWSPK